MNRDRTDWGLEVADLEVRIGRFTLRIPELRIPAGQYFVLSGHNGAGKSVFVRTVAGLLRPISGRITLAGRAVETAPPWEREIGYVPQDGILFPNRTVRGNISFPLEVRKVTEREIAARVESMAEQVGIRNLLDRRVGGLSGGERQRVCLARALVFEPCLLLLDEPVSAIDEGSRDSICRLLREAHDRTGVTTIHVSHNRHETELVGDRVGVLHQGILQEIYDVRPA